MVPELSPLLTHAIALMVGLIPLVIYFLGSRRKVLGYATVRNVPIVTIQGVDHAQQIEIHYAGRLVQDLRSVQILLQNIGGKDIENQRVDIQFPTDALLMNWQVEAQPPTTQTPPTCQPASKTHLQLQIRLMNPGDKILLSALTAHNKRGVHELEARGANLKFRKFDPSLFISPAVNVGLVLLCASSWTAMMWLLITGSTGFEKASLGGKIFQLVFLGLMFALLASLMFAGLVTVIKRLKDRIHT